MEMPKEPRNSPELKRLAVEESNDGSGYGKTYDSMLCGIGPFKYEWMQSCARIGVFTGVYSLSALITSVLYMYIVSQITAIEKQYGLSSSESGFLLSCNDIGFLLTTLLASYFARRVHIPRVLWLTTMLYGFAGILCSMAYFVSKDFAMAQGKQLAVLFSSSEKTMTNESVHVMKPRMEISLCVPTYDNINHSDMGYTLMTNESECDASKLETSYGVGEPNKFTKIAMTFIAIGMIIQGIGKAPRNPFLTTYIDDNVKKTNTAMYLGILSGIGIFGPAIAFAVGSLFSRQYVTLQDVPINPRHPAWIGAWWLGFVVFGLISIVVSLPLLCFPRRLRRGLSVRKQLKAKAQESSTKGQTLGFFKSVLRLIRNKVYMPMIIGTCFYMFGVAGKVSFTTKYLETQYFVPAWKANLLMGVTQSVSAASGTIAGGFFVTKRKLSPFSCLKLLLIVGCLRILLYGLFFIFGCGNPEVSGYTYTSIIPESGSNATCGSLCGCKTDKYFPVCGSDNRNYMSPCHAGCTRQQNVTFGDCSCIALNATATPGLCETSCKMIYPYIITVVCTAFCGTFSAMPTLIVIIRSVSEVDKPMAVGFHSLLITMCGWLSGPIIFGVVIDTTCSIWTNSCSGKGACAMYDIVDFRVKFVSLQMAAGIAALLMELIAFIFARKKTDWSLGEAFKVADNIGEKETMISQTNGDAKEPEWSPIHKGLSKNIPTSKNGQDELTVLGV